MLTVPSCPTPLFRRRPSVERNEAVNVLRAVVCFGILLKHFTTPYRFASHWHGWQEFGVLWLPGTECFLVVAGYFLAHMFRPSEAQFLSVPQFARRRGYRLLVPYWVALGVAYLGLWVWRAVVPGPPVGHLYEPWAVLANALCVADLFAQPSPMVFFWTVATLMQMYTLWAATFWVVRRYFLARGVTDYHARTEGVMIPLTGLLLVGSAALTAAGGTAGWGWQLPRWGLYPAAGALAYWAAERRVSPLAGLLTLLTLGAVAAAADSPRPLFAGLTGLLLVATGSGRIVLRGRAAGWVAAVGRCSYSVYLMHGLVGVRVWAVCGLVGLTSDTPGGAAVLVLLAVVGSLAAGWVLYVLLERPMARQAARVDYRR